MSRKSIETIAKMMEDLGLTEIADESSVFFGLIKSRIHISKQQFCQTNAATGTGINFVEKGANPGKAGKSAAIGGKGKIARGASGAVDENGEVALLAPMVGVVYFAPEPGAKPFCEVGKQVSAGDTLALVEAMKTFNPIKADRAGIIKEILVKDGDTVEFGTPLIVIK